MRLNLQWARCYLPLHFYFVFRVCLEILVRKKKKIYDTGLRMNGLYQIRPLTRKFLQRLIWTRRESDQTAKLTTNSLSLLSKAANDSPQNTLKVHRDTFGHGNYSLPLLPPETWTRNLSRRRRHTDNMTLVLRTCSMQMCANNMYSTVSVCVCAHVCERLNSCPAPRTASAPQAFSSSLSNFSAIWRSSHTVHHDKVQLPSHLAQVVLTSKQREPKDSGTETSPDVKLNCGSLSLRFLPPRLPWHPRQRGDKSGTASPAYTASGESLRSYLLYHLHCRTAVDCCLTSTLLWMWGRRGVK